jgi:hypothetical protein
MQTVQDLLCNITLHNIIRLYQKNCSEKFTAYTSLPDSYPIEFLPRCVCNLRHKPAKLDGYLFGWQKEVVEGIQSSSKLSQRFYCHSLGETLSLSAGAYW